MKKALTVAGMALASLPAGIIVFCGLVALDLARVARGYATRGTVARVPVTKADREAFEGRLQEHEFRVMTRGQTIIPEVH